MTVSAARHRRAAEHPPTEPMPWHPRYVWACWQDRWTIQIRSKSGDTRRNGQDVYRCMSRHHAGPCRDTWARRLYGRLTDPQSEFTSCPIDDAMFWTLTLPPEWHRWVTEASRLEANGLLGRLFRRFKDALNKRLARMGLPSIRYFWIRETHRSGVPHLHMLVVHVELAQMLRERDAELGEHPEVAPDDTHLAPGWLRELAEARGFGGRFDAQVARNREALSGYATKVCSTIDDVDSQVTVGEVVKGSQVPELLPRHCRSYGYSRRFIPPRHKDPDLTGWIEDEHGRVLAPRRARPDEVEWLGEVARIEAGRNRRPEVRPVFDARNVLTHFASQAEAYAYACGGAPGNVARVYQLVGDDWTFTRNPKTVDRDRIDDVESAALARRRADARAPPWRDPTCGIPLSVVATELQGGRWVGVDVEGRPVNLPSTAIRRLRVAGLLGGPVYETSPESSSPARGGAFTA